MPEWATAMMMICLIFRPGDHCRVHEEGPPMLFGPIPYVDMASCEAPGFEGSAGERLQMLRLWTERLGAKRNSGTAFCKPLRGEEGEG